MPTTKQQFTEEIDKCRFASLTENEVARKMFILDPTFEFKDDSIRGFRILNKISEKFRIPLSCIKIAGSAQTGFSPVKDRGFSDGQSDLDVAIVNPWLFQQYCEIVFKITNGYRDRTRFESTPKASQFQENLQIGYFRPDLMPSSNEKLDWFKFFDSLTKLFSTKFSSINGGIYFSELFFESKQAVAVKLLKK